MISTFALLMRLPATIMAAPYCTSTDRFTFRFEIRKDNNGRIMLGYVAMPGMIYSVRGINTRKQLREALIRVYESLVKDQIID